MGCFGIGPTCAGGLDSASAARSVADASLGFNSLPQIASQLPSTDPRRRPADDSDHSALNQLAPRLRAAASSGRCAAIVRHRDRLFQNTYPAWPDA